MLPATATARAHARAALVGNPSDGYGGRTIAFTFGELHADVTATRAPELMTRGGTNERRLLRAAYDRFAAYCAEAGSTAAPCALSVSSSIPPQVGLAGSSAIIVAALRALAELYEVPVPAPRLPMIALAAEEDLGIPAGLQDRVAQVYGGLVYMDFDPVLLATQGHGAYEILDPGVLADAYVAWSPRAGEHSARFHRELRRRFRSGNPDALAALAELAELARAARGAAERGDRDALAALVDANFDLRARLGPLDPQQVRMVEIARSAGASANFTGSGGAITGFVADDEQYAELRRALAAFGCTVIRPTPAP